MLLLLLLLLSIVGVLDIGLLPTLVDGMFRNILFDLLLWRQLIFVILRWQRRARHHVVKNVMLFAENLQSPYEIRAQTVQDIATTSFITLSISAFL